VYKQPTEYLPLFEESATEVADEVTSPRPEGEEEVEPIQVPILPKVTNICSSYSLAFLQLLIDTVWHFCNF
jgi:hypothetical protein